MTRADTQRSDANAVLRPPSSLATVAHNQDGFGLSQSGLLVPGINGIVKPGEPKVLKLNSGGDSKLVKVIKGEEVEKYGKPQKEKDLDRSKVEGELLFYLASPWDYFNAKLKKVGVDSPVLEIQKKMKAEGFVNTAKLDYNHWDSARSGEGQIPDGFYQFLQETVQFAVQVLEKKEEWNTFFGYLNLLVETQIYANRCYKLNDKGQTLEKIMETIYGKQPSLPITEATCDFFSYFEIPDLIKKDILPMLPPETKHPLRRYLVDSLEVEAPGKLVENIGIEIEGFPTISMGDRAHPGFEMGEDGGGTMPELRRRVEDIGYNKKFKEDLFELWYWAKMTKIAGASVHIHVDFDGNQEVLGVFQRTFGFDRDSVREGSPQVNKTTVEVRLNLPFYEHFTRVGRGTIPSDFDPSIYSLNGLIEEIIRLKQGATRAELTPSRYIVVDKHVMGDGLHPYWKARFRDKSIKFEEADARITKSGNDPEVIVEVAERLSPEELIARADDLIAKSGNNWEVIKTIVERLPLEILVARVDGMIPKSIDNWVVIKAIVRRLPPEILVARADDLITKSGNDRSVIEAITERLPQDELVPRADGLISKSYNYWRVIGTVVERIPLDELVARADDLISKAGGGWEVVKVVVDRLPEKELIARANSLISNSGNDQDVIMIVIERFPPDELVARANGLISKSGNDLSVIRAIVNKMPPEMLAGRTNGLISRSENDPGVLNSIVERLPVKELIARADDLISKSKNDSNVIRAVAERLPVKELIARADDLISKSGNNWLVIKMVLSRLPTEELVARADDLISKSGNDFDVIRVVIDRLPEEELVARADDLMSKSGNDWVMIRTVARRLPLKELIARADDLIAKSRYDRVIIKEVIDRLPMEIGKSIISRYKFEYDLPERVVQIDKTWGKLV